MELPKKGVKWCSYRHAHLFYVSVFIFVNIWEFKPNFMMYITVVSIMMSLLYMTGEIIGAEDADLIAPVLRHKTVKYEFRISKSSNQNIVYTGLNVLIGRYFECEYKIVLGKFNAGNVLPQRSSFFSSACRRKKTIRALYSIYKLFWLDDFRVQVRNLFLKGLWPKSITPFFRQCGIFGFFILLFYTCSHEKKVPSPISAKQATTCHL